MNKKSKDVLTALNELESMTENFMAGRIGALNPEDGAILDRVQSRCDEIGKRLRSFLSRERWQPPVDRKPGPGFRIQAAPHQSFRDGDPTAAPLLKRRYIL